MNKVQLKLGIMVIMAICVAFILAASFMTAVGIGSAAVVLALCVAMITYELTKGFVIGRPMSWEDVSENIPFQVKQQLGDEQLLVEFYPGGICYIAGYPGLSTGGRGWYVKVGDWAESIEDPRPPQPQPERS